MQRGIFVSFEGSEGCGKSTQIKRLAATLQRAGANVLLTREPGGTAVGEQIRNLLQYDKIGHAIVPETELLLFTASRAQLTRELIAPALTAGSHVLADRFLDSTTVYQGIGRKLPADAVDAINRFAVGSTLPDVTFILDLVPEEARRRMLQRAPAAGGADRMEQQPESFYEAVRSGYLALAVKEPERMVLIDGAAAIEVVEQTIWQELVARFPLLSPVAAEVE